ICDRRPCFRQQRTFLEQPGDDALDQSDLGVFETLEPPSIELEAEDTVLVREAALDHLEDAGLPRAPIAVNANRHRALRLLPQQRDDRLGDCFVVKEIDLRFVVGEYHAVPPRPTLSKRLAPTTVSPSGRLPQRGVFHQKSSCYATHSAMRVPASTAGA